MIDRDQILANLEKYDLKKAKVGVIGSHSALDTCDGAKSEGFSTLAVCQKGRDATFSRYFKTVIDGGKHTKGFVDETLVLDKFSDVLNRS